MKRLVSVLGAVVAVLLSVVTADAAGVVVNKIYSPGQIVSPTEVTVAAKATCDPGPRRADFSIRLVESTSSGDTTGNGTSAPLTCDGREHRYIVAVDASTGTWTPGAAQVYVATFYLVCTPNPNGPPNCVGNATPFRFVTTIQLESKT